MESESPPQPSPVPEAPPSGRWLKRIIKCVVGLLLFLALAAVFSPRVIRCRRKPDQTQATNNARQIGMALFEFEAEYGKFPDASTIATVKAKTGRNWTFGSATSNDVFKQLIAAGIAQNEEMFYAKGKGVRKPDNRFESESDALAVGECGFAYIPMALDSNDSSAPIAVAPIIPGTFKFDPEPFDGKAVVLRADNSVQSYSIASDGHVIAPGGKDIFDPSQPWWHGKPPFVFWPAVLPR